MAAPIVHTVIVNLRVTNTGFRDISTLGAGPRFCDIVALTAGDIEQGADNFMALNGAKLRVKGGGFTDIEDQQLRIGFRILPLNLYAPIGMAVVGKSGPDATGEQNFSSIKINGPKIFFRNHCRHIDSGANAPWWEIYIAILAISGANTGRMGIIDPGIENSDEVATLFTRNQPVDSIALPPPPATFPPGQ